MHISFTTLGALALLASSVTASGIHLGGKRALAADCKRSAAVLPSVSLQTTAISPQPTSPGTGSGGPGNSNGTTPTIRSGTSTATGASQSKSGAGIVNVEWSMGALAAAGVIAMVM